LPPIGGPQLWPRRGHNEKEELATRRTDPSAQLARCLQRWSLPHLHEGRGLPSRR